MFHKIHYIVFIQVKLWRICSFPCLHRVGQNQEFFQKIKSVFQSCTVDIYILYIISSHRQKKVLDRSYNFLKIEIFGDSKFLETEVFEAVTGKNTKTWAVQKNTDPLRLKNHIQDTWKGLSSICLLFRLSAVWDTSSK